MEERQEQEKHDEGGRGMGNVVKFTRGRSSMSNLYNPQTPQDPQSPVTDQELADFRKYWPLMKQMLAEFKQVKSHAGCPVMRSILELD